MTTHSLAEARARRDDRDAETTDFVKECMAAVTSMDPATARALARVLLEWADQADNPIGEPS